MFKEEAATNPSRDRIRAQLQKVLTSPLFLNATRQSQFLEFVVTRTIDGHSAEIKESLIGVQVYGRDASYDPKEDSIVRAEASRLRAKLREYYSTLGQDDPIRIDLPKGAYSPVFTEMGTAQAAVETPVPAPRAHRTRWAPAAALLVVALAGVYWYQHRPHARRIVVMTPSNLGGDPANNGFGENLADEMTRALIDSPDWKVVGRAPVADPSGRDQVLRALKTNYGADAILTGNYRIGENAMAHISLQLVDATDGYLVWTKTYEQRLSLLAEGHNEFVHSVVEEITHGAKQPGHKAQRPGNEKAAALYDQAREAWRTYEDADLERSAVLFRQAAEADPNFAPAWSGLADADIRLSMGRSHVDHPPKEEGRQAALRAIQLDDSLAEAHAALGSAYYMDWDFPAAARELRRAVALDPIRVTPNVRYSEVLTILGDFSTAETAVEAARARLPFVPEVLFQEGSVFLLARKFDRLEAFGRQLIALEPQAAMGHWLTGLALEQRNQLPAAIEQFKAGVELTPRDPRSKCALSHAYAVAGQRQQALDLMNSYLDRQPSQMTRFTLASCAALTYTALGDRDRAFEWLEKAREIKDSTFPFFPQDPRFDSLKSDPRYAKLAATIKRGGV